jgi:hypothetical protein
MKRIIATLAIAGLLAGTAAAQVSTGPDNTMPNDNGFMMGTNGGTMGATGSMNRVRDRFGSDTLHRSTNRMSSGSFDNGSGVGTGSGAGAFENDTRPRVNTKAGTQAEPIRGENTPGGTTPKPGGSSSTLPPASAPNF